MDNIARVWNANTGEPLFELTGMSDTVEGIQFSPDGKYIRTAGSDGTLRKYVVSTEDLIDLAYGRLTRWWRPEECSQYLRQAECPTPQQDVIQVDYANSAGDFSGIWQTASMQADTYLRFLGEGRLIVAQTLAGLDEAPLFEDNYDMDLSILNLQDAECGDKVGKYRLRLVKEPKHPLRLIMGIFHDACFSRASRLTGSYVQVAP
jgi:hypothetical protein